MVSQCVFSVQHWQPHFLCNRRHVIVREPVHDRVHGRVHQRAGEARSAARRPGRAPPHPGHHAVRVPARVRPVGHVPGHHRLRQVRQVGRYVLHYIVINYG